MFEQNQMAAMPQQPYMGGYAYQGVPQPVTKFENPLTGEQIKHLQQNQETFSLSLTNDEYLRAICNHRSADGTHDTLTFDNVTGEARCMICGWAFKPVDPSITIDSIKEDIDRIIDVIQTIKLMYIDFPPEAAKEFMQIIPLMTKIPKLFEFAAKNMTKHEANNWLFNNRNMGAVSMLNNLQNTFGMMNGGFQPQFQQPMGAPAMPGMAPQNSYAMPGQPVGMPNPGFGYPGASMPNPVNPGYVPANPGFAFTPNTAAASAPVQSTVEAPAAPEAKAAETNVTQTVKA